MSRLYAWVIAITAAGLFYAAAKEGYSIWAAKKSRSDREDDETPPGPPPQLPPRANDAFQDGNPGKGSNDVHFQAFPVNKALRVARQMLR